MPVIKKLIKKMPTLGRKGVNMQQGIQRGIAAPAKNARQNFRSTVPGLDESIWEPLYHYQTYPAAGTTVLTFFQTPMGQNGATYATTNMTAAGQMSAGQEFVVTGIGIDLLLDPDSLYATAPDQYAKDFYSVMREGYLKLFVGSKDYLIQGPLATFPVTHKIDLAITPSTGATTAVGSSYATTGGQAFQIVPVTLAQNQNFSVTLHFDSPVAISADARIGVKLYGYKYRSAQ